MAANFVFFHRRRNLLRRNRILRDRTNPLDSFNDDEILAKLRFRRQNIFQLTDTLREDIEFELHRQRLGTLPPALQVCLALSFFATGTFQDVVGETIGVSQQTTSRIVRRVTLALLRRLPVEVKMPVSDAEAVAISQKFYGMNSGFPNVIGCIDGTHVKIKAPTEREQEYVNPQNFHSINVQVICDADLLFINVIARWPGSVHDADILRRSAIFRDFESPRKPVPGVILGDSGYMLRDWLMTPISDPTNLAERAYNYAHYSTWCTVERAIGMAKRRWQCLHSGLRVEPERASEIIAACLILHNVARRNNIDLSPDNIDLPPDNIDLPPDNIDLPPDNIDLTPDNIDLPPDSQEDDVHRGPEVKAQTEVAEQANPKVHDANERRRQDAGQFVRQRFIERYFTAA